MSKIVSGDQIPAEKKQIVKAFELTKALANIRKNNNTVESGLDRISTKYFA